VFQNGVKKVQDFGFIEGRTRVKNSPTLLCNLPDANQIRKTIQIKSGSERGERELIIYKATLCNLPDMKQLKTIKADKKKTEGRTRVKIKSPLLCNLPDILKNTPLLCNLPNNNMRGEPPHITSLSLYARKALL